MYKPFWIYPHIAKHQWYCRGCQPRNKYKQKLQQELLQRFPILSTALPLASCWSNEGSFRWQRSNSHVIFPFLGQCNKPSRSYKIPWIGPTGCHWKWCRFCRFWSLHKLGFFPDFLQNKQISFFHCAAWILARIEKPFDQMSENNFKSLSDEEWLWSIHDKKVLIKLRGNENPMEMYDTTERIMGSLTFIGESFLSKVIVAVNIIR